MMNTNQFKQVSLVGRIAYGIMCAEYYAKATYPDKDWTPLFKNMWAITNAQYWDEWANKYIEVIPEYLFEFPTYEASDFEYLSKPEYDVFTKLQRNTSPLWNNILKKIYEMEEIYAYSTIPGIGLESISILSEIIKILDEAGIQLPPIEKVAFSHFEEREGWGEHFDGSQLSTIISPK